MQEPQSHRAPGWLPQSPSSSLQSQQVTPTTSAQTVQVQQVMVQAAPAAAAAAAPAAGPEVQDWERVAEVVGEQGKREREKRWKWVREQERGQGQEKAREEQGWVRASPLVRGRSPEAEGKEMVREKAPAPPRPEAEEGWGKGLAPAQQEVAEVGKRVQEAQGHAPPASEGAQPRAAPHPPRQTPPSGSGRYR